VNRARWFTAGPIGSDTDPRCTCAAHIVWDLTTLKTLRLHARECQVSIDAEIRNDYYSGPPGSFTGD
jgi:hypothetical protein